MIPRERRLAIIIGGIMGALVIYQFVNMIALAPYKKAQKQIEDGRAEADKYEGLLKKAPNIRRSWESLAGRTFSYEPAEIRNQFEKEVKRLVAKHRLQRATYTPRTGSTINRKPSIKSEAYLFTGEGDYDDVMAFLRDVYRSPSMTQITSLTLLPMDPKQGRNQIKISQLIIETPLLPKLASVDKRERAELVKLGIKTDPPTLSEMANPPKDPVRRGLIDDVQFAELADRNIFRMYMPAPTNIVKFENKDRLDVSVSLKSFWDGKETEQLQRRLPGKSMNETQSVTGDVVEVTAVYADGKPAFTRKLDGTTPQPWTITIPSHTPPEQVILTLDNQDENPVDVTVTVTGADGKADTKPTIRLKGKSKEELDAYIAKSVQVSVTYDSGKAGRTETFNPREDKQTFVISVEPVEVAGPVVTPPKPEAKDADPDPNKRVSGRWMYGDHHEMFAVDTQTNQRVIYAKGDAVDDGVLIAAHPAGGVVYMEATKHYYLYPIGQLFPNRILLEGAEKPEDLGRLIDEALARSLAAMSE